MSFLRRTDVIGALVYEIIDFSLWIRTFSWSQIKLRKRWFVSHHNATQSQVLSNDVLHIAAKEHVNTSRLVRFVKLL